MLSKEKLRECGKQAAMNNVSLEEGREAFKPEAFAEWEKGWQIGEKVRASMTKTRISPDPDMEETHPGISHD